MQMPSHVDILIVGGGPVGGALALALAGSGHSVLLAEARSTPVSDPRALALAHGSREQLAPLGLWPDSLQPTAIREVHVSQQNHFGVTRLHADELQLPALGYVVGYDRLAAAVDGALRQRQGLRYACGQRVLSLQQNSEYVCAELEAAALPPAGSPPRRHTVTARLAVLAEGGKLLSQLRHGRRREQPYDQVALLAELQTAPGQRGTAFERFASDGPLALLPHGDGYALVWTQSPAGAERLLALDDAAFLAELRLRISDRLGRLLSVGPRAAWPLTLKLADPLAGPRLLLIGNAAQTLHPVAGQGFNLGLRDATTLAQLIRATPASQLGDAAMLARYRQLRRRDAAAVSHFTDGLIKLFGVESRLIGHGRGAGLWLLDSLPPLRRTFSRQMVFGLR